MRGRWQVELRVRGRERACRVPSAEDCGSPAMWRGQIHDLCAGAQLGTGEWFVTGYACGDHRAELREMTSDLARDWQPCPGVHA